MGITSLAPGITHAVAAPAAERVVVVGAGPVGMSTAIELAQRGIPSTVLEARGPVGTREQLFNVVPPLADRLAALDESLVGKLVPTSDIGITRYSTVDDAINPAVEGKYIGRTFSGTMAVDATRSRGSMDALINAAGAAKPETADTRSWSKVGIGDLDNALREVAATKFADLIDIRYDTPVASVRQGEGWAEAVLKGGSGPGEAVRGAMLVDTSGRNLAGAPQTVWPEQSHWLGTRFPAREADAVVDGRAAHPVARAYTKGTSAEDRTVTTSLETDDRTVLWTEVPEGTGGFDDAAAMTRLRERAALLGITDAPVEGAKPWRVDVQLSATQQAGNGRLLAAGDSVRSPYFMTSTGAAAGVIHDAPHAVDTIESVLRGGADAATASAAYDVTVRAANDRLVDFARKVHNRDIGVNAKTQGEPTTVTPPAR